MNGDIVLMIYGGMELIQVKIIGIGKEKNHSRWVVGRNLLPFSPIAYGFISNNFDFVVIYKRTFYGIAICNNNTYG